MMQRYTIVGEMYQDVSNLEWTTEPPKEVGWYWAERKDRQREIIFIDPWNKSAYRVGQNAYVLKSEFTHWLGPIPEPEPPQ